MEDGHSKFDVSKVSRTLGHVLAAGCASVRAVDAAQLGVIQSSFARPLALLIHSLWVLDVANTHVLSLFRREETELNLLHRLERRLRVGETRCGRHSCGGVGSIFASGDSFVVQAVVLQIRARPLVNSAYALLFTFTAVVALHSALIH